MAKKENQGPAILKEINLSIAQAMDKIAAQKGRSELMLLNVINNEISAIGEKMSKFVQENIRIADENTALHNENETLNDALMKAGEAQAKMQSGEPDPVTN